MGIFHCGAAWEYINDLGIYYDVVRGTIGHGNIATGAYYPNDFRDISGAPFCVYISKSDGNTALMTQNNNNNTNPTFGAAPSFELKNINTAINAFSAARFTTGLGTQGVQLGAQFTASNTADFFIAVQDPGGNSRPFTIKSVGNIGAKTANPIYLFDADGAINSRVYYKCEDFDEETNGVQLEAGLRADEWTGGGTNYASANVTYTGAVNGEVQILTTAADDDSAFIMGLPQQAIDNDPIFETRFKMTDITHGFCGVGLVEGSFVDKAAYDDDICLVGIDSDNGHGFGAARLVLITNDNNAGAIIDDLGVDLVAGTYVKVKLDLTDTEQPRVWVNDTEVAAGNITGTVQAGISMANYAMTQALSAAADTLTVDYFKNWNDR